jgi:CubicO group peptidase (beta-lactamase class C family)
LTLACLGSALCLGQNAATPDRYTQVVESHTNAKTFMGSVLVARGDEVVFNKSFGSANLEWNIANSQATKFRLGSITKQSTATPILLLEERGKLKVDDLVKKHMPRVLASVRLLTTTVPAGGPPSV